MNSYKNIDYDKLDVKTLQILMARDVKDMMDRILDIRGKIEGIEKRFYLIDTIPELDKRIERQEEFKTQKETIAKIRNSNIKLALGLITIFFTALSLILKFL